VALFPVFLDLEGRAVLVAGGGGVGLEKARSLLDVGADITVVDPFPSAELSGLAEAAPGLRVLPKPFVETDCDGCCLVFACTGDPAVDADVLAAARRRGIPACSASDGEEGDLVCGAVLRRGDLCLAVSSAGASPSLAALARDRAAGVIGDEFATATAMLAALRRDLRREVPAGRVRRTAMRAAALLLERLEAGDEAGARELLARVREQALREGSESGSQEAGRCTR
jgi:precorrin-2 dehydrogenase/sirohydrochlorin ferrochelatase